MDDLSSAIKVIGIGGAGINMVLGILNNDFRGDAEFIMIDSDRLAQHLIILRSKITYSLTVMSDKEGYAVFLHLH